MTEVIEKQPKKIGYFKQQIKNFKKFVISTKFFLNFNCNYDINVMYKKNRSCICSKNIYFLLGLGQAV